MKIPASRRGFTLIELLMGLTVFMILAGLSVASMRGGLGSADSHSLAMVVAEQFRLARQTAMSSQEPVAVVLPTNQATVGLSQSLYIATGTSMAHVERVNNYRGDHGKACLMVGTWPLTSGSFTLNPTLAGQSSSVFNVTQWLSNSNVGFDMNKDYAFVFQPDGSLVTNGVPFDANKGAYYLIASAGATVTNTAPPAGPTEPGPDNGLSYFQPLALARPWAITLTPSGEVSLQAGLPGGSSVPNFDSIPVATTAAPPNPTSLPALSVNVSVPGGVEISPVVTDTDGLPSGVNTTLAPGQRLSLAVNCTESSGRDVYISWSAIKATGNSGATTPANGTFSTASAERMSWDPKSRLWKSTVDWSCPLNSSSGDRWTFVPSFGPSATGVVAYPTAGQGVESVKQPKIWAWISAPGVNWGPGTYSLTESNLDGTGQSVVVSGQVGYGSASDEIFTCSQDGGTFVIVTDAGFVSGSRSGREIANVTVPDIGRPVTVRISPRGDRVMYAQGTTKQTIAISNLNGSNPTTVFSDGIGSPPSFGAPPTGADTIDATAWSASQAKLAVATRTTANGKGTIWVMNSDGTSRTAVCNTTLTNPTYPVRVNWDKTGRYLYIGRPDVDYETHRWDSVTNTYDPAAFTSTSSNSYGSSALQFTPDNTRMYFLDWAGQNLYYQANTPLAPVQRVPFVLPRDPILGPGRILSFGISQP